MFAVRGFVCVVCVSCGFIFLFFVRWVFMFTAFVHVVFAFGSIFRYCVRPSTLHGSFSRFPSGMWRVRQPIFSRRRSREGGFVANSQGLRAKQAQLELESDVQGREKVLGEENIGHNLLKKMGALFYFLAHHLPTAGLSAAFSVTGYTCWRFLLHHVLRVAPSATRSYAKPDRESCRRESTPFLTVACMHCLLFCACCVRICATAIPACDIPGTQ